MLEKYFPEGERAGRAIPLGKNNAIPRIEIYKEILRLEGERKKDGAKIIPSDDFNKLLRIHIKNKTVKKLEKNNPDLPSVVYKKWSKTYNNFTVYWIPTSKEEIIHQKDTSLEALTNRQAEIAEKNRQIREELIPIWLKQLPCEGYERPDTTLLVSEDDIYIDDIPKVRKTYDWSPEGEMVWYVAKRKSCDCGYFGQTLKVEEDDRYKWYAEKCLTEIYEEYNEMKRMAREYFEKTFGYKKDEIMSGEVEFDEWGEYQDIWANTDPEVVKKLRKVRTLLREAKSKGFYHCS